MVAIAPRPGLQRGRVGTRLRLRQRKAADPFAAPHSRQKPVLRRRMRSEGQTFATVRSAILSSEARNLLIHTDRQDRCRSRRSPGLRGAQHIPPRLPAMGENDARSIPPRRSGPAYAVLAAPVRSCTAGCARQRNRRSRFSYGRAPHSDRLGPGAVATQRKLGFRFSRRF